MDLSKEALVSGFNKDAFKVRHDHIVQNNEARKTITVAVLPLGTLYYLFVQSVLVKHICICLFFLANGLRVKRGLYCYWAKTDTTCCVETKMCCVWIFCSSCGCKRYVPCTMYVLKCEWRWG